MRGIIKENAMRLSINTFQRIWLSNIIGTVEGQAAIVRKATKLHQRIETLERKNDD
jgi:hypothetical protein